MSKLTAWEILESARYNLEVNLPKMVPMVKGHPIYLMGIEQLNNGLKKMEEEAFDEEREEERGIEQERRNNEEHCPKPGESG